MPTPVPKTETLNQQMLLGLGDQTFPQFGTGPLSTKNLLVAECDQSTGRGRGGSLQLFGALKGKARVAGCPLSTSQLSYNICSNFLHHSSQAFFIVLWTLVTVSKSGRV